MKKSKNNSLKNQMQSNKNIIIRVVFLALIGIVAIISDAVLNVKTDSINVLVEILFSSVTVIAGLWISCYLLFLQLYKDRYPIKILKECYLPSMRYNFTIIVFCVIYGSMLLIIRNGYIANLYYSVLCISSIIEIMYNIYSTNKSLMINNYIDNVFQEINNELELSKNVIRKETFKNIKYILDESIVKEEYFVIQNITERLGVVYRTFLQNSLKFEGENANAKEIEESFDNIVSFNISELKLCSKINSEITIDKIISQQIKNIVFCIEKNQYEWFKKYINEYGDFLFNAQKQNNSMLTEKLYATYKSIIVKLLTNEKSEWIKHITMQLNNIIKSLVFFYDYTGVRNYCSFISGAMIYCLEKPEHPKNIYDEFFNSLKEFTLLISKNSNVFDNVKMCYALLFNELLNKSYEEAYVFYEEILENSFGTSDDPVLLEFKTYCIGELHKKSSNNKQYKDLLEKHAKLITEIITIKDKYQGYLDIPDFETYVRDDYSSEKLKYCIKLFLNLLDSCIIKDNLPMYYTLVSKTSDILVNTEQRDKEIQKELINIYFYLIYRTRVLINKQYLEITFQLLENAIKDLDTKRKISSSLADFIIFNISKTAQINDKDNHNVIIKSTTLLFDLLDKNEQIAFATKTVERKKSIYRAMFNIGTCCIENGFEEGLRQTSNYLGWFIINSITDDNNESSVYLIERAIELYNIAEDIGISSQTQTFLLTLFTTVGTFCCKDPKYTRFLKRIINGIKSEELSDVQTAIRLRTSENDTWNNLFDNRTEELSKKFIKELTSIR